MIKTIKKWAKTGFGFARDPRGCDAARKATWQSHAGPRERLRGAEVTRVHIYIYRNYKGYSTYKHYVFVITLTL